jgi:F-type H+-transporting ATPase subunit gamma
MNSLKSLRLRIKSVTATQKMTAAMKMIAVARLRPARQQAEASQAYGKELEKILGVVRVGEENLAHHDPLWGGDHHLLEEGMTPSWIPLQAEDRTHGHQIHLLIVITSDRGLCGGYNTQILKQAKEWVENHRNQGNAFRLICMGRKGYEYFKKEWGLYILKSYDQLAFRDKEAGWARIQEIGRDVRALFLEKAFDYGDLIYMDFHNLVHQSVKVMPLLPFNRIPLNPQVLEEARRVIYLYEPALNFLIEPFVFHVLESFLYNGFLQSQVSEHAARMHAMDGATRNASDMMEDLTLHYNHMRQGLITKELMEIISGSESLKNT